MSKKTALILSAHAADFVWRCGGAIALHAEMGYEVTVACMSFGERGESARLWKDGKREEAAKRVPDAMVTEFQAIGTADMVKARLQKYKAVGINTLGLRVDVAEKGGDRIEALEQVLDMVSAL